MTLDYKEVARKAADELTRRGWLDGDLVPSDYFDFGMGARDLQDCKVCAVGALNAVVYGDPRGVLSEHGWASYNLFDDYPELLPIATPFAKEERGLANDADIGSIWRFNDNQSDGDAVIDLFLSVE